MMVSRRFLQNKHTIHFILRKIPNTNLFRCDVVADDFFNRLGPSTMSTSVPEPSIGDRAKGKQLVEGDPPLRTMPPKESYNQREEPAPSTSRTTTGETSRKNTTKIPKDPLEDFVVPPAGTPYGE